MEDDTETTVIACCEIVRRGIWNMFRLENEHLHNCDNYRAISFRTNDLMGHAKTTKMDSHFFPKNRDALKSMVRDENRELPSELGTEKIDETAAQSEHALEGAAGEDLDFEAHQGTDDQSTLSH